MDSSPAFAVEHSRNVKVGHKLYKRKWDKKYACPFCSKNVAKLPRHLNSCHKGEPEVVDVYSYPAGSVARRLCLEKLHRLGMFKFNSAVYQQKSGTLKPMRRPAKQCAAADYTPCEHCLDLFLTRDMWKHVRSCKHKPPGTKQKRHRYSANMPRRTEYIILTNGRW